jgi:NADP-dependent aldehyde dehydrogenase
LPSQSVNPRTGQPFGPVLEDTTIEELDAIVMRAVDASIAWANYPSDERARVLDAVAAALHADAEALAQIADEETGLGLPRLVGEVARTAFQLRMFADALRAGTHLGTVIDPPVAGDPPAGHPELRQMLLPLGPVAVYGASNFPFAFSVLGGDTASALAAGCTVVVKAHPSHPQTCERVAQIARAAIVQAGAPDGTFTIVRGFEAGVALVEHPGIKAGAFTGSTAGGRALFDLAVRRPEPIPFYGELGSVNPVVVTSEAAKRADLAQAYVASLCMGAGQFCTNPGLIFVPRESGLSNSIADLIATQPPGVLLNANVESNFGRHLADLVDIAGVRVIPSSSLADGGDGFTVSPAVLVTDVATALRDKRLLTTEVFGPVGVVVEYDGFAEVLTLIDALEGCLVSTIHAESDEEMVPALVSALMRVSGRIVWNGWPTGVAVTGAQHHGGPYPTATSALHTSVGTTAMRRFQRPVAFQSMPLHLLPPALQ